MKEKKFYITDPENADRVLEVLDKKFVFKRDMIEKLEVSEKEAKALVKKYPYLVVNKE